MKKIKLTINSKMRKFQHTKNPWFGSDIHPETGNIIIKNVDNVVICEMLPPYSEDMNTMATEETANLRLVQYAPSILQKLCEVEEIVANVISGKISIFDIKVKDELASISTLLNKIEII